MRAWHIAFLAGTLMLAGVLLAMCLPTRCPVTRAAFARVKDGMTRAQVEAVLGGPPGNYRTWQEDWPDLTQSGGPALDWQSWDGDEGNVFVGFTLGVGGVVDYAHFTDAPDGDPGPVGRLWWRLKRLAGRAR